jgi:guanylate kinase
MEGKVFTGHVLLIMAPTGSGKGTLERHVLAEFTELKFAVSCTTRAMRPGEQNNREYHFITRELFQEKIEKGEFLEWAEFSGNLYGTLKTELLTPLQSGQLVLNEIELQGIEQIKEIIPKEYRTVVYINAGSWEDSVKRALARAPMTEEELRLRKVRYDHEVKALPYADVVIDNRDGKLEDAKKALSEVVANIFQKIAR